MTTKSPEEIIAAIKASIDKGIAEHGVHIMHVFDGDNSPAFSYTIGLTTYGLPELIVFGLPVQHAHPILHALAQTGRLDPENINPGILPKGIMNIDTLLIVADDEKAAEWGVQAYHYFEPEYAVSFRQIVLPDEKNLYPWQEGYNDNFIQPILGEPVEPLPQHRTLN